MAKDYVIPSEKSILTGFLVLWLYVRGSGFFVFEGNPDFELLSIC